MQRVITIVLLALLAPSAAVKTAGAPTESTSLVVMRGEVVDLLCYLADAKRRGSAHEACAREGIAAGNPVGLLTTSGEVYLLLAKDMKTVREMFEPHAGQQVKVTGHRISRGRMNAIMATAVVPVRPAGQ